VVVTWVMIVVCVVGVLGAIASSLSYDEPYGHVGSPMRIPKGSRKAARRPRPSRQLRALEAALEEGAGTEQRTPRSEFRSRGRRRPD
jgi:hypothetical protein